MSKKKKKNSSIKIKRDVVDLLKSLMHHLELLINYSNQAFTEYNDEKYLGEVAGKLRILIIERGCNQPLLLKLMDNYSYERRWSHPNPNWKTPYTLRTFLHSWTGNLANTKDSYKYEELVRFKAQQSGSSHEDWELDERLVHAMSKKIYSINGSNFLHSQLRISVNIVLTEACYFLLYLYQENILKNENVDFTLRQIMSIGTHFPTYLDTVLTKRSSSQAYTAVNNNIAIVDKLFLSGKIDSTKFRINGIISKAQFIKNGPSQAWWLDWIDASKYFETGEYSVIDQKIKLF